MGLSPYLSVMRRRGFAARSFSLAKRSPSEWIFTLTPFASACASRAAVVASSVFRVLSAIAAERGEEVCACDLVELSGRSQPTVSHHMKILVDAGLVTREKRGLWVWYRIEPSRLDALRAVLT